MNRRIRTALLLSCAWLLAPALSASRADDKIELPDLTGLDKYEAMGRLDKLGLRYSLGAKDLGVCAGNDSVSQQQPLPKTLLAPGSVVILWIDVDGSVAIPDVSTMTIAAATAEMMALGLLPVPEVLVKEVGDTKCPSNKMVDLGIRPEISTTPAAGTSVCGASTPHPITVKLTRFHVYNVGSGRMPGGLCP